MTLPISIRPCISSGIDVKAKETVSEHNGTDHLFKLNYTVVSDPRSMNVDYSQATADNEVEGTIDNDVFVEVKLYGHDGASHYLAREVEVENEDEDIDTDD